MICHVDLPKASRATLKVGTKSPGFLIVEVIPHQACHFLLTKTHCKSHLCSGRGDPTRAWTSEGGDMEAS